jgi:uncharacterized membrane protein
VALDAFDAAAEPRLALLLGTEGPGLSEHARGAADVRVRIPMSRGVDSLNVAAAAAVACWAMRRRASGYDTAPIRCRHPGKEADVSTIEKSIEVNVPINVAYNQWTQFEEFPQFMEGVEEVRQLDDKRLHWKASILGVTREWDAEIVDQKPDQQVAWRAIGGTKNDGVVMFFAVPMDTGKTRVALRLEFEPEGAVEKVGDALNLVERRAQGDLERFKEFIEKRGAATGGWRGVVKPSGEVTPDAG